MSGNRRERRAALAGKAPSSTTAVQVRATLEQAVRLHQAGKLQQAVTFYEQALALDPGIPEALSNLALALKALGRADDAIARCEQALKLKPDAPEILLNLGMLLRDKRRSKEAAALYRRALGVRPNDATLLSNLGNALKDQGEFDEAIACFGQALALRPNYRAALANLDNALFDIHFSGRYGDESTLDAARLYARYVEAARPANAFANVPDPERRLRVGYVSGDFRKHAVAYLFNGLITSLDHSEVEAYCYSNSTVDDDMTALIRSAAHGFRTIADLSDAEAEATIRRDRIDILVDLSGHTVGNRLPLFALKPAPVQVLTLGYLDTTGLAAMDYVITDRWVIPPEDETSYTEKVLRLPDAHFCFAPGSADIPVTARPAGQPLTLGSFNNWAKSSETTLALWARVMAEIPDSRLMLKSGRFDNPVLRSEAIGQLAAHGVSEDRLIVEGFTSREDLLAAYNRVDIGLSISLHRLHHDRRGGVDGRPRRHIARQALGRARIGGHSDRRRPARPGGDGCRLLRLDRQDAGRGPGRPRRNARQDPGDDASVADLRLPAVCARHGAALSPDVADLVRRAPDMTIEDHKSLPTDSPWPPAEDTMLVDDTVTVA